MQHHCPARRRIGGYLHGTDADGRCGDGDTTGRPRSGADAVADTARITAETGDARAELALKVFTRSVRKTIGSYLALLGGLDALVFAGGIGEHDAASREEILVGLQNLGIVLSVDGNKDKANGLRCVSDEGSGTVVYVVPAEEDLMIARHVVRMSQRAV